MFFCRRARHTSVLYKACKPAGILELKENIFRNVAWISSENYALQCCRALCASTGVRDVLHRTDTEYLTAVKNCDSSRFLMDHGRPFDRVPTFAVNLSKTQLAFCKHTYGFRSPHSHVNRSKSIRAPQTVLFTAGANVSPASFFTTNMQTRASSMAAATQKQETWAGKTHTDKGEELEVKEPSSPSSFKPPGEETEPEDVKPSKTQQLKKVFKEYGAVGVSFHVAISLMSLGMFYFLVTSGIDMAAVLCKLGFSETVVHSKMAAGTSTFVLAYAIHKLFAPVRISITLVSVPLVVRYFRKTGLFKPPTAAP